MSLFNFFKKDKKEQALDNTLELQVSSNAGRLVDAYNEMLESALDYSETSLAILDELLDQFHQNSNEVDEEMKSDLKSQAGSYILEVGRRNYGGKYYWYDQYEQPILVTGEPNFKIALLAIEKVGKRIENGIEDNIPYFFEGYSERVKKAIKGDDATII